MAESMLLTMNTATLLRWPLLNACSILALNCFAGLCLKWFLIMKSAQMDDSVVIIIRPVILVLTTDAIEIAALPLVIAWSLRKAGDKMKILASIPMALFAINVLVLCAAIALANQPVTTLRQIVH